MIYLVFSSSSLSDVLSYIVLCGLLVLVLSSPDVPLSPCMLLMCLVWKGGVFFYILIYGRVPTFSISKFFFRSRLQLLKKVRMPCPDFYPMNPEIYAL